jgi:glutamine amidotransferase
VLDYGMGNLASLVHALEFLGARVQVVSSPKQIVAAERLILPGVGAFRPAMEQLVAHRIAGALREARQSGIPILGICLGMQLLFDESEEGGEVRGLGWIPGRVVRFKSVEKVPHMGWNQLKIRGFHPLFDGIRNGAFVYFVHSYYCIPERAECEIASSHYGESFCAAVQYGNVMGVQFHPEKSQKPGLRLLKNFLTLG